MDIINVKTLYNKLLIEKSLPFIKENSKLITQFILTVFFFGLGIWFLKHERAELTEVRTALFTSRWLWVLLGIVTTALYLVLQGLMYVSSFYSIRCKITLKDAISLFLKRNLVSVFLPAGGVSSLAFFTTPLEDKGITKTQIHYASTLYGFVGIVSVILMAIPAFIYSFLIGQSNASEWIALSALLLLAACMVLLYRLLMKKGAFFRWVVGHFPAVGILIGDFQNNRVMAGRFLLIVFISVVIELTGIAHVFIAMKALHVQASVVAAVMAYIVSVIFLVVSPFLRGLGAIEVSMSIILVRFGFSNVEAISITLLYRFFEFWTPLVAGVVLFVSRINKLLMRIIPAVLLLMLGIVNIVSVVTPTVAWRVEWLQKYIMLDIIHASNYFVLAAGFFLLVTAAFMLKGLRSTWWLAILLSIVSMTGHITKAVDYEEASFALFIIIMLILTRKDYYVRSRVWLRFAGIRAALLSIAAIIVFGITGFFLLDKKHFNTEFNLWMSFRMTLSGFFMAGTNKWMPLDAFARDFVISLNIGGFLSLVFLLYTLVRPYVHRKNMTEEEMTFAGQLISRIGKSSLDYFKNAPDKLIFRDPVKEAFISYRITGNFAVVLEDPVAASEAEMISCIRLFDNFCFENSLKSIYYRIPEESVPIYSGLKKKHMFIGQEAVVQLTTFNLEGGSHKSLRNAINKVRDRGFKSTIHLPPIRDGLLQKMKAVSDEWLRYNEREEIIFSQGMFVWEELKQHTVITVENAEEKVVAFLNIIPDHAPDEGTYDLMRKTADAPNGVMDFILIELFWYMKSKGLKKVNLGFAPLSGIHDPHNFREKSMKFAYEKIRSLSQYKGLREFKAKFDPVWYNKYLVYDNDYDLLQVPSVLSRVIKP